MFSNPAYDTFRGTEMRLVLAGLAVECVEGDIARQPDVEAVVNAANAQLAPGGGVAGAIHRAAGPELWAACRPLAPIRPGEAVLTPAFRLPNRFVIHCLGPVYGVDVPSDEILARAYRNVLELAEREGVASLATPALSTGAFGYPMEEAARVAARAIVERAPGLGRLRLVRFVLRGRDALRAHEAAVYEAASGRSGPGS